MASNNYKAEIVIKKTVGQVFTFVSNVRNLPLWSGGSGVEVVSETPNMVGSIYKVIFSTFLTKSFVPVEITKYSFPNSFSFIDNSKKIIFNYTFERVQDEAKVSLSCKMNESPFSLSLLKMNKLLVDLKKYLETHDSL